MSRRVVAVVLAAGAVAVWSGHAAAQETGLKAGFSVSRLDTADPHWDDRLTATAFAGHLRFRFGPIALQPELQLVTKGASASAAAEEEQIRIEYIEVPVLLVLPARVGAFEPFAYGGPALMLESRCRWVERQAGLRTSVTCDPPPVTQVFARSSLDYGLVAGGGISYPIGAGKIMLEARHNWGMRNIRDGDGPEVRNRTFAMFVGYSIGWSTEGGL